jgi:hypothetical protein
MTATMMGEVTFSFLIIFYIFSLLDEARKAQKPGRMYKNRIEHEEVTMYKYRSETK